MKKSTVSILASIIDRRTLWRIGRSLYLKARADVPNDRHANGEEMMQRQLIRKFAGSNETLVIFDVGANIGDWTWFILQESAKRKMDNRIEIHSFEPVPSTFQSLQNRIDKHPFGAHVHLVPLAFSSEEGIEEIFFFGDNAETNSLHADASKRVAHKIQITKTTADTYCLKNDITVIHYLKCDTEGHDMEVLNGARRLFQKQRIMACQFEYNYRWVYSKHYLKDAFDYVKDIPYNVGKITLGGVEIYEEWHPELERFFEGNYMLIHDRALHWFQIRKGTFDIYNTYGT